MSKTEPTDSRKRLINARKLEKKLTCFFKNLSIFEFRENRWLKAFSICRIIYDGDFFAKTKPI